MLLSKLALTLALTQAAWLPTGIRWSSNRFPIPYCITANGTNTNLNANQQRAALLAGVNAWVATGAGGSLSCTTYTAAAQAGACRTTVDTGDGSFNIFFEDNWSNGQSTIGVTWSTSSGQSCGNVTDDTGQFHQLGCKFDSDIELNDNDFFWDNTGNNTDITSITTHEYGHFIGLDHCNDNGTCNIGGAVMYAAYAGGTLRVPFADDIQGACALYPGTPGGLGWACSQNSNCTNNICVNPGNSGYCSQTCGTCPAGYACGPNPQNAGQQVCLRDDGLNKQLCEVCQTGLPGACANNGICITGLPSPQEGRCVTPAAGGCPTDFQSLQVQFQDGSTGNYCFPRSNDCNDPGNFTELQLGQQCGQNSVCANGLTCVGICSPACDPGACPAGWGCEAFQGGQSFCLPGVTQGRSCEGLTSCLDGPCLVSNARATCFKDCAGNPGACNNAQTCNTYNLQGGGTVSICEPPGVPPNPPDAGFPDTGVPPVDSGVPDGGVGPVDTGVPECTCNTSAACEQGCACDPQCTCACDVDFTCSAGCACDPQCGATPDAGSTTPDAGFITPPPVCACDNTFSCDDNCACDPECNCACDLTYDCDPGCGECDPECATGCACSATPSENAANGATWGTLVVFGLLLARRRRGW